MCVTDRYMWSIMSICHDCKKKSRNKENPVPHSCEAYPKKDGIPSEVWDGSKRECRYFEKKDTTSQ